MSKEINYEYLIGQYITNIKEDEIYIYFITKQNYVIRIDKFVPYCACYVGEYIDEIKKDGVCFGTITNIETNMLSPDEYEDEDYDYVYKGNVTFYFENGKIDMKVHGEDNGYYGVAFNMPVEILKER